MSNNSHQPTLKHTLMVSGILNILLQGNKSIKEDIGHEKCIDTDSLAYEFLKKLPLVKTFHQLNTRKGFQCVQCNLTTKFDLATVQQLDIQGLKLEDEDLSVAQQQNQEILRSNACESNIRSFDYKQRSEKINIDVSKSKRYMCAIQEPSVNSSKVDHSEYEHYPTVALVLMEKEDAPSVTEKEFVAEFHSIR